MSVILGYRRADFISKDGQTVKGCNVYIGDDITRDGAGLAVERMYLSDRRAETTGIDLAALVGKHVTVLYDRRGRIASIATAD